MACSIELLSGDNAHLWEEFNAQSPNGTFFHGLRWKQVLEDALDLKLRYYLILNDRRVVGISPWVEQSVLNFRGLVSIPHSEENGVVVDDQFGAGCFGEALSLFAKKYSFLHFNTASRTLLNGTGFAHEVAVDTGHMVANLGHTPPEAMWAGFSKSTRSAVRTFENDGFRVREVHRPDDLEDFYRYYTRNLAHIQGDILPLTFFERIRALFSPKEQRMTVLTRDDLFAGGSLALLDPARKTFYGSYLALNRDLPNRYTPAYYIMWEDINWAWKNGYDRLFFGRQRFDPKNPRFLNKVKFGAQHQPIQSNLVLLSKPMQFSYKLRGMLSGGQNG